MSSALPHVSRARASQAARVALVLVLSIALAGCGMLTKKEKTGGDVGAAAGGVVGAIIGAATDATLTGIILGAALGGAAGILVGKYMDRQAADMHQGLTGATVERVGEGIKATYPSSVMFMPNSAELLPQGRGDVRSLSTVAQKYPDTNVLVAGHTDSGGSAEANQQLSERRARAVADALEADGVSPSRIRVVGYGESQPIASNTTPEGRARNRRVEVGIYANDNLKSQALAGTLQ